MLKVKMLKSVFNFFVYKVILYARVWRTDYLVDFLPRMLFYILD